MILVVFLLNPFDIFYRHVRGEMAKELGHLIIAPFGRADFKETLFGDILTSLAKPL